MRKHADQLRLRTNAESTPSPVREAEIDDSYDARIPQQTEPNSNLSMSDSVISDDPSKQDTTDTIDTPHNESKGETVVVE